MSVKSFFPTFLYSAPLIPQPALKKLLKEVKGDCLKLAERDEKGRAWSESHYTNGYTSYSSIPNIHENNSLFIELRKKIDRHVARYAKSLGLELDAPLCMQSCWINIMPPGAAHSLHLHPLSVVSGTFYVEVPKGSGVIKFEDPRLSKMMISPPRIDKWASGAFARIEPEAGHVVLFESWLRHEVEVNRGKNDRISISFNYS